MMRTLYLFNMVSVDGYFEGPGHDIGWHTVDSEFNDFAVEQLCRTDLLLFGRRTYELMASYWPHYVPKETTPENARTVGRLMNSIPKLVASRSMTTASWQGTRMVGEDVVEVLQGMKQEPGEEIGVFGSADLAGTLMQHGLIDEFRLMVCPVLLGGGTPLFPSKGMQRSLRLKHSRTFGNGNTLLCFTPPAADRLDRTF